MGKPQSKGAPKAIQDRASAASAISAAPAVSVTLTPDELLALDLPEHYQVKVCSLCGNHSASPNPFDGHKDCKSWGEQLPWSSGTRVNPRGEICRVCFFVFSNGGFVFLFQKIRDYMKHVRSNPEQSAEFIQSRDLYISKKQENPNICLKGCKDLWPERVVRLLKEKKSTISAPKKYLMELDEYTSKFGKPKPELVTSRTFGGQTIRGVLVTKQQDKGMWELGEMESQGAQMEQQCSDMQLRADQAEQTYQAVSNQLTQRTAAETASQHAEMIIADAFASPAETQDADGSSAQKMLSWSTVLLNQEDEEEDGDANADDILLAEPDCEMLSDEEVAMDTSSSGLLVGFATAAVAENTTPSPPPSTSATATPPLKRRKLSQLAQPTPAPTPSVPAQAATPKAGVAKGKAKPKAKASGRANKATPALPPVPACSPGPVGETVASGNPGVGSLTQSPEGSAPPQTPQIMTLAMLLAIPKDGGVMKLTPPSGGVKSGQGKRSAEEMAYEDGLFLCERKAELKDFGDFKQMPDTDEVELIDFCKGRVRNISSLCAKCASKLTSLKRRKDGAVAGVTSEILEIQMTANVFLRLFTDCASESPTGSQLNDAALSLLNAGYELNRQVHIKRVRAILQDDLRFGKLDRLFAHFQSGSWVADLLSKLDSGSGMQACAHADMLAEQLFQRMLRALPTTPNPGRSAAGKSLVSLVCAFAKYDRLEFSTNLVNQLLILRKALFCLAPDGSISFFATESLDAIDRIEKATSDVPLLMAVASLPQCATLLAELKGLYTKAKNNNKNLEELSNLKKVITAESTGAESGEHTGETWKQLFDRLCVAESSKPTPDTAVILKSLKTQWLAHAGRILSNHIVKELGPYLGLLSVDIDNKVQLHETPKEWTVALLRDAMCQCDSKNTKIHVAFQCHDFLAELSSWHDKLLKKDDLETSLQLSLFNLWDNMHQELKTLIPDQDALAQVASFEKAFRGRLLGELQSEADTLVSTLRTQVLEAAKAKSYQEETFSKSVVESMRRLASVLGPHNEELGSSLQRTGEAGEHFLSLSAACLLYSTNKTKIAISSRPDKMTTSILKALQTTQATSLGYFRKHKTFEVAGWLVGKDDQDILEEFGSTLKDLLAYNDVWENELLDLMSKPVTDLVNQVRGILAELPDLKLQWAEGEEKEKLKEYQDKVVQKKLADLSSALLKKTDACAHCCKLGGIPDGFVAAPISVAKEGLSIVAALSWTLLLSTMCREKMTPDSVQVDNSTEKKTFDSLVANMTFVENFKLQTPEALFTSVKELIQSCK